MDQKRKMKVENVRNKGIDIAKGIGVFLMIMGHSGIPEDGYNLIYGFHMALFFIIAGILYNKDKWEKFGFWELVKRRAKSVHYTLFYVKRNKFVVKWYR